MNFLLREIERCHKCADLHVDFIDSGKPLHSNGLFSHDGVTGMLEAYNYKPIEISILFFNAVCEWDTQTPLLITPPFVAFVRRIR